MVSNLGPFSAPSMCPPSLLFSGVQTKPFPASAVSDALKDGALCIFYFEWTLAIHIHLCSWIRGSGVLDGSPVAGGGAEH